MKLFMPIPIILNYFSGLTVRGITDYRLLVQVIQPIEYIFRAGAMVIANDKAEVCPRSDTQSSRSNKVSEILLFTLLAEYPGCCEVF